MDNVIHRLTMDLAGPDLCPVIEVQRGDSARSLIISLTQGGQPYRIEEGLTAALYGKKPDGNPLFNACTIEQNQIRYDFTPQTANVAGAFDCEIWLVAGDKRELTTPRFTVAVDERMRTDDVIPESEPEYTAITEMVAAGTAMIEELREALAGLEGVEEILAQARAAMEDAEAAASRAADSEAAARGHAKTAADAAADALGYAEDAEAQAKAAKRSEDNSRINLQEAETAAQNAEAAAKRAEEAAANAGQGGGNGSGQNPALTTSVRMILGNIMTIIKAQVEDENGTPQGYGIDVSGLFAQCDALIAAMGGSGDSGGETPEKILSSISAVYSGGSVPAGTALDELVGVAVTAHYGDGSTAAVTDYTLSGVIAEGSNTVVVSYGGMTATFQVVGTGSTVYLTDIAQFDQFIIRKALSKNNEDGAWSVEVPYTEGMTVSGCIQPSWKNSYGIAVITAPDGTQSTSFNYDTQGVRLVDGGTPVQQYTAVLAGFAEGSTVRINMFMGPSVTTEELARAFAATHKEYLYYEPGEV